MKVLIERRFVSRGPGKSWKVALAHPLVPAETVTPGEGLRIWHNRVEISRPARSIEEVCELGGGRCCLIDNWLWLSFPDDTADTFEVFELVADLPIRSVGTTGKPGPDATKPLLILGPQRCGSTALLWALDRATDYKAPKFIYDGRTALEGYHLRTMLEPMLRTALYSPFGKDASDRMTFLSGTFARSGFADLWISSLSRQINDFYSLASGSSDRWIDKCPGWETVIVAPFFAGLFPQGRCIMLTREPIGCVLSIARLSGPNYRHLPDTAGIQYIATCCAAWVFTHFLWRVVCAPMLPEGCWMTVRLSDLKQRPQQTVQRISSFLNLPDAQQILFLEKLVNAPVASHPTSLGPADPRLSLLIWNLCGREALAWGYERPVPGDPAEKGAGQALFAGQPGEPLAVARHQLRGQLIEMLEGNGMSGPAARRMADILASEPGAEDQTGDSRGSDADYAALLSGPGPLLFALLQSAAEARQSARSRAMDPESGDDPDDPLDSPLIDAASSVSISGKEPGPRESLPEPDAAAHDTASTAMAPASVVGPPDGWQILQEYSGHLNRGGKVAGHFTDRFQSGQFKWSATFRKRCRRAFEFDCSFNGHAGVISVQLSRGDLEGSLFMGGRSDWIKGWVRRDTLHFCRWFDAGAAP